MSEGLYPPVETISGIEALQIFNKTVSTWKIEEHSQEENHFFLLNISHWALETLGQMNSSTGSSVVNTKYEFGDGFSFSQLPEILKKYAITDLFGEKYESNQNNVVSFTADEVIEEDPYIFKWDELSKIPIFTDMVATAQNNPEIMAMLIPGKFIINPRVEVKYSPGFHYKWGLQYIISSSGIEVIPFGEFGHTNQAFEAAKVQNSNASVLIETALKLISLNINNARWLPAVEVHMIDILESRLKGSSKIDISKVPVTSKPKNSIKNLLFAKLIENSDVDE